MTTKVDLAEFGEWMNELGWVSRGRISRTVELWIHVHSGNLFRLLHSSRVNLDRCTSEVARSCPTPQTPPAAARHNAHRATKPTANAD